MFGSPMLLLAEGARRNQDEHADQVPAAAEGRNMHDANQARIDQQLGKRLFRCQKLMTELQNVETCLEWVRDQLPVALLLQYAPGLLGLPELPQAASAGFHPAFGQQLKQDGRLLRPQWAAPPLQSSPAQLHEAHEYLQAANTRERFMRKWREQAFGANTILIPRDVARAKDRLTIPEDPWQSFPSGEGVAADHRSETFCGRQGYIPGWVGAYAAHDWEYIVSHLEQKTAALQRAIGAQFRHPEGIV